MVNASLPVARPGNPLWTLGNLLKLMKRAALRPFYALYEAFLSSQAEGWSIPRHVGIILDGNRRFARQAGLVAVTEGHRRGADKLEEVLEWCEEVGIKAITVWVFSLDNFGRSEDEVEELMDLFEQKFLDLVEAPRVHQQRIRIRSVGRLEALPARVQAAIEQAEAATADYRRRHLNIGVAYGGREEIIDAFRALLEEEGAKGRSPQEIAADLEAGSIEPYLYTSHVPDPDLIIRTSGEVRLSGFLLWQSAYSEYYFCDTFWPAFRKIDFLRALRDYHQRQRRFGK